MSIKLSEARLPLPLFRRGKVRDTYDLGHKLLIVSTDRLSAFDVVLPSLIPDKGLVLNQLSCFWFAKTKNIVPNHFVTPVDTIEPLGTIFHVRDYSTGLSHRSVNDHTQS